MRNRSNVRLPDELLEKLARQGRAEGQTVAQLTVEAVRQLMDSRGGVDGLDQGRICPAERHFFGFISYSHTDRELAARLHRRLERYRIPRSFVGAPSPVGPIPKRLSPLFRDEDEFATSSNLGERINVALRSSKYLIVVCSPRAAVSRWVNQEIAQFRRNGGASRILCLIAQGEPGAAAHGQPALECFPPALCEPLTIAGRVEKPSEPLAADVRSNAEPFAKATLRLIAAMLGVDFDKLWQRDRRRHRAQLTVAAAAAALVLVAALLGVRSTIQARNEVIVANAKHAASLWDRLDSRDEQSMSAEELNVLWEFGLASHAVRDAAADELARNPDRAVRLGRRPNQVLRALFLHWPRERSASVFRSTLQAVSMSTDDDRQTALRGALSAMAETLPMEERSRTARALLEAMQRTDNAGHISALAHALVHLPGTLTSQEAEIAIKQLFHAIPSATTAIQLQGVSVAIAGLPDEVSSAHAEHAFRATLEASRLLVKRLLTKGASLHDLQSRVADQRLLASGLAVLSEKLTPAQAAAVLPSMIDGVSQATVSSERQILAQAVTALSSRNLASGQAQALLPRFMQVVRTGRDSNVLAPFRAALVSLAAALTPAQAEAQVASSLADLRSSNTNEQREAFAALLTALARKLPQEQAWLTRAEAVRAIVGDSDAATLELLFRAEPPTAREALRRHEALIKAAQRTTTEVVLGELTSAMIANGAGLQPEQWEPAFEDLWSGLEGVGQSAQVDAMESAMKALVSKVTEREAPAMFNVVLRNFPGRDGMIDGPRLQVIGRVGVALVSRMSTAQRRATLGPVLGKIPGTPHSFARQSIAAIVTALADSLLPDQRRAATETMRSMLAWAQRAPEAVAAAEACLALNAQEESADEYVATVIEVLKYPTAPAEATTVFLNALRRREAGLSGEQVRLSVVLDWMVERNRTRPSIDVDALPACPPPPRAGLTCPSSKTDSALRRSRVTGVATLARPSGARSADLCSTSGLPFSRSESRNAS